MNTKEQEAAVRLQALMLAVDRGSQGDDTLLQGNGARTGA